MTGRSGWEGCGRARAAALLALALGCAACAGTGGLPTAEVARGERRQKSPKVEARIEQAGSTVTLTARGSCDLHRFRTLERTTTRAVQRTAQPAAWGNLGTVSLIMASLGADAGGAVVLGEALTASPASPSKAVGGALLSALGLTLTGVTIWLIMLDNKTTYEVESQDVDDGLVREDVPCLDTRSLPSHEPVTGRLPGPGQPIEVPLGETDQNGKLEIDLVRKLPRAGRESLDLPATMPVYIRGVQVGSVRLDEVARAEEDEAWRHVLAEDCASGAAPCRDVEAFLRDHPHGRRADEARAVLTRAEAAGPSRREAEQKAAARQAEENARANAAGEAARRGAAAACRQICKASCHGTASCTDGCVAQSCR